MTIKRAKPVVLFDIDYTLFNTHKLKESNLQSYEPYEEVKGILMRLKTVVRLGIFSKGETQFQKTKLEKIGMLKFFEENDIHIFDDKDANLMNVLEKYKDSKLILVDDKLGILHSANKHLPQVTTVWVKRGPYAESQKPIPGFKPDATITKLNEIIDLILNT